MSEKELLRELHELCKPVKGARFGTTTVQTHLPPNFQDRIVIGKGGKPTHETWRFLTAQAKAEGGNAKWNPLNSTLWVQNFTSLPNYNDIPVRNYAYPDAGIAAMVLTLTEHNADGTLVYGHYVNELQHNDSSGHTAEEMVNACIADLHTWGTSPDLMLQVLATLA